MFSSRVVEKKKEANNLSIQSTTKGGDVPSIIAADLRIVGNLICGGSIEIEGEVHGNVTCTAVTVRRTGGIKGDIVADIIQIDGEVNGLVKGKNISVSESGRVIGVIIYESLAVKDGAYIEGQCKTVDRLHHGHVHAIAQEETALNEVLGKIVEQTNELQTSDGQSVPQSEASHVRHRQEETV